MKYIDEYRDKELVLRLTENIRKISRKDISLMEVCGGHTMSIQKFGIPSLLPDNIKLISGPGCPVCVSSRGFIDQAIAYSRLDNVIITTYGDLIRVPGSTGILCSLALLSRAARFWRTNLRGGSLLENQATGTSILCELHGDGNRWERSVKKHRRPS